MSPPRATFISVVDATFETSICSCFTLGSPPSWVSIQHSSAPLSDRQLTARRPARVELCAMGMSSASGSASISRTTCRVTPIPVLLSAES